MTVTYGLNIHYGWWASISDGTQRFESEPVEGEPSSWQKLLQECRDKNLQVTQVQLRRRNTVVTAMPHKMCDGYVQAYEIQKALFRGTGHSPQPDKKFQGIGSIVDDKVFITWVNIQSGEVYQDCRPLASMKIHSTLKEATNDRGSKS